MFRKRTLHTYISLFSNLPKFLPHAYNILCNDNRRFTNFGFKTPVTPPQNEYLKVFENDMYKMIRKIEFIKVRNGFQDKLKQDLETIRLSKNELAFADKSANSYELSK